MIQAIDAPALTIKTHRLCVAFLDCPTVAKDAANYLVLAQNRVQRVFEFDAFDLDALRAELRKRALDNRTKLRKLAKCRRNRAKLRKSATLRNRTELPKRVELAKRARMHNHDKAVFPLSADERKLLGAGDIEKVARADYADRVATAVDLATRFVEAESARVKGLDGSVPNSWVVFTEACFTDRVYLSQVGEDIALVSLGEWHTSMAPPSALEFIVRMTQAACADFFLGLPVHYFTKGCLLDFNQYLEDTRLMVLIGNLCDVCRARATAAARRPELAALLKLLDKEWVGDTTQTLSVASVLKKVYDYDLYVSRGLAVNKLETFWDNVTSTSAQEFIRIIAAVVAAFVLLKFGLKSGG